MTGFGDHDPEDAYDAGDPVHVRLSVIVLALKSLAGEADADRRLIRRAGLVRLLRRIADEVDAGDG